MGISASSATYGSSRFYRSRMDLFVENLNNSYNKLQVRSAKQLKPTDQSRFRSIVAIDPSYIEKAAASERVLANLDNRLRKIGDASDAFGNINAAGHKVALKGYTIDKSGRITVHGIDFTDGEEPFEIDLGRVGDDTKFKEVIYEHFGVTVSQLLFNTNAGFDLFA